MTTQFRDASGQERLLGTIYVPGATVGDVFTVQADGSLAPAPGGGSQTVKIVDLGVVDIPSLFTDGPVTLHTMETGEFLASIRFTDLDQVVPDVTPVGLIYPAFGTVKSFGWHGFAWFEAVETTVDSAAIGSQTTGYGPFAALDTGITTDNLSLVLSAAAAGVIQASTWTPGTPDGAGFRLDAITDWVAVTAYDAMGDNTIATPGALMKAAIVANGTCWTNTGAAGTSGAMSPDFAGNAGGTVADGPDIVWTDTTQALPTVGAVHLVAEIWTPS